MRERKGVAVHDTSTLEFTCDRFSREVRHAIFFSTGQNSSTGPNLVKKWLNSWGWVSVSLIFTSKVWPFCYCILASSPLPEIRTCCSLPGYRNSPRPQNAYGFFPDVFCGFLENLQRCDLLKFLANLSIIIPS